MRRLLLPSLLLALGGACARPASSAAPASRFGAAFTDSAAARRLCESPDSVLAGRKACVLRDQRVRPRIF